MGKTADIFVIYGMTAVLSMLLFAVYFLLVKKKEAKVIFLFLDIVIVNVGYFCLSAAGTLEQALAANRLSYFGSAFLPLVMLLLIMDTCRIQYSKAVSCAMTAVSLCAFLLAASGGWLNLYYREVSISTVNGVTRLMKVYGPLHILYPIYLFGYFGIMLSVIAYAAAKKKIPLPKHAAILVSIAFGNLAVWMVEQLINVDFEFLSVSYIVTGIFLFLVHSMVQDYENAFSSALQAEEEQAAVHELPPNIEELFVAFAAKVKTLTPTERKVLQQYIDGYTLEEFAEKNCISINTAKKHNTNMNRKLGVTSREELFLYIDLFRRCGRLDEITYQN